MRVDYCQMNARTKSDGFPILNVEKIFGNLNGSSFFTTFDLISGYWQIPVSKECKDKTTFTCMSGTYKFRANALSSNECA